MNILPLLLALNVSAADAPAKDLKADLKAVLADVKAAEDKALVGKNSLVAAMLRAKFKQMRDAACGATFVTEAGCKPTEAGIANAKKLLASFQGKK